MEAKQTFESSYTSSPAHLLDLQSYPYLQRLSKITHAYPALGSPLNKLRNTADEGRRLVAERYKATQQHAGSPGRCAVLTFRATEVCHTIFDTPESLRAYLEASRGEAGAEQAKRLFILEDMHPEFVDILGQALGVDPLIFSEQMSLCK